MKGNFAMMKVYGGVLGVGVWSDSLECKLSTYCKVKQFFTDKHNNNKYSLSSKNFLFSINHRSIEFTPSGNRAEEFG